MMIVENLLIRLKTRAQIKQDKIENEVPVLQRGSWAKLLARVFMIDVTRCVQCGGEVKAIAVIFEKSVTSKILSSVGLNPQPPPQAPARTTTLAW